MFAVFALHEKGQRIESADGGRLPLTWMPFVCAREPIGEVSGFERYDVARAEIRAALPEISVGNGTGAGYAFLGDAGSSVCVYAPTSIWAWHALLHYPDHPFMRALDVWNGSAAGRLFLTRRKAIDLRMPQIMGIWNVTPDSFSSFCEPDDARSLEHGARVISDGADILDIGAESTRPGSAPVDAETERARLETPLSWAASQEIPISLDTRNIETMQWALAHGYADIINDVALCDKVGTVRDGAVFELIAATGAGYIAMAYDAHDAPARDFDSCCSGIVRQIALRLCAAWQAGCDMRRIAVDPGIGFGKGIDNDIRLIAASMRFLSILGRPVLIGHSRKRCLARAAGLPTECLDDATAIASGLAFAGGAGIVRVHAPKQTALARRLFLAMRAAPQHDADLLPSHDGAAQKMGGQMTDLPTMAAGRRPIAQ